MAYRKSTVVVSAEDQATDVVDRIGSQIVGQLESIGRAGDSVRELAESFGLLNRSMADTQQSSRVAREGVDGLNTSVVGLVGNVATAVSGFKDLIELGSRAKILSAANPLAIGTLGIGAAVAGGFYEEAAMIDERTREASRPSPWGIGAEQARVAYQARVDRENAAEQARIDRNLARGRAEFRGSFDAEEALRAISDGTGRIDPAAARRSMEGAISRSYDRGAVMSADVRFEWINKADQAAQARNKAADAAEREARATEHTLDVLERTLGGALQRGMSGSQRFASDTSDILGLQDAGLLTPDQAFRAWVDSGVHNAPRRGGQRGPGFSPFSAAPLSDAGSRSFGTSTNDVNAGVQVEREQLEVLKDMNRKLDFGKWLVGVG